LLSRLRSDTPQTFMRWLLTRKVHELENELKKERMTTPFGAEELAQGDDLITIKFDFRAIDRSMPYGDQDQSRFQAEVTVTWDQIISRVAPAIALGATEAAVKGAIGRIIGEKIDWGKTDLPKGCDPANINPKEEAMNCVRTQLLGLGYIQLEKPGMSTSVRWMLTKLGEAKMFNLLSMKRTPSDD
ncbi:MAG TPA: hypothetical protein PLA50_18970, partial [Bacteroidia bacterium]|nr:hypothetical protein [Bacteroidia bacterium]